MKKMFENWKRYVESRDSDQPDDVIEETSVGAGMQGYAGAPLGSKEDNEEFNENEKETSKLKGDKLAEMYSTKKNTLVMLSDRSTKDFAT